MLRTTEEEGSGRTGKMVAVQTQKARPEGPSQTCHLTLLHRVVLGAYFSTFTLNSAHRMRCGHNLHSAGEEMAGF